MDKEKCCYIREVFCCYCCHILYIIFYNHLKRTGPQNSPWGPNLDHVSIKGGKTFSLVHNFLCSWQSYILGYRPKNMCLDWKHLLFRRRFPKHQRENSYIYCKRRSSHDARIQCNSSCAVCIKYASSWDIKPTSLEETLRHPFTSWNSKPKIETF